MLALWGATAFGFVHAVAEYIAMTTFSDANWDVPPGTGYLTAAVLVTRVVLTVVIMRSPTPTDASAVVAPTPRYLL
jgi:hypothetical protein